MANGDPPKRPRSRTAAEDELWDWVRRKYFDYIDGKKKLGGFAQEWHLLLQSSVRLAPQIDADVLLAELVKQFGSAIWALDPVRRPAREDDADDEDTGNGETHAAPDPAAMTSAATPSVAEESDLFSVAGVVMPEIGRAHV